jgi:hypothetical protein
VGLTVAAESEGTWFCGGADVFGVDGDVGVDDEPPPQALTTKDTMSAAIAMMALPTRMPVVPGGCDRGGQ